MDRDTYKSKATIIKALAHPSRLMMVDALAEGEMCVCDLQRLVGADLSTVSKHLTVMKHAGIVADRKEGLKVFYRLRVPCVLRFFDCVDAVLRANSAEAARAIRRS
jgi:DNA-binding transcriptional ArsR family regulator